MRRKSLAVTVALVLGIVLGGLVVSPALRGTTASAQTQPPTTTQPATPSNSLWNQFLDKLAGALNVQRSALDSAIVSAGNSTADEAVQQGTLSQAQADALKSRIQSGDLGALMGGRHGGPGRPDGAGVRQAMLDAAARVLNITTAELQTQLQSGQSVAQLAQAHGTTEQAVIDAALAAAKTQLDQAVSAGTLTQAQADSAYAELQQRGASILSPRGGRGGHGGRHGDHATPAAPATPASPAPGTSGDA